MDVFDLRKRLIDHYASYTRSFIKITDPTILARVDSELDAGAFWPEPLLQLNPTFQPGGTIDDLVADGTLHAECARIFRIDKTQSDLTEKQLLLYTHQTAGIQKAKEQKSDVLTSGTGSGKSLAYIVPIVDHVLRCGSGLGTQAIVVYPMSALANGQNAEIGKFLKQGYPEGKPPVRLPRYTGQEKGLERDAIRGNPPDILLTSHMMLELLLTQSDDCKLVRVAQGLRFLVFDELHTYLGRQGPDVAQLIGHCRQAFGGYDIICIGTSETMASGGSTEDQKREVAKVANMLFGVPFDALQVIVETLERATPETDFSDPMVVQSLHEAIQANAAPPDNYDVFRLHPLASWIETTFGVRAEEGTGCLLRQSPRRLQGSGSAAEELAGPSTTDPACCAEILRKFLLEEFQLRRRASSRFPIFAFRLHQFFTRDDTVWATIEPTAQRHLEMSKKGSKPDDPEKPLFPLVFCRQCGAAYHRVNEVSTEQGKLLRPREDCRKENDDGRGYGYLYVSDTDPWPRTEGLELLDRFPAFMKETSPDGVERIAPGARSDLPGPVFVHASGQLSSEGQGIPALLTRGNFLFCLHPSCGVAHTKDQRSERPKLGSLGVDNRSTATTILAVRSLIELQADRDHKAEARKFLSFTNTFPIVNRKDQQRFNGDYRTNRTTLEIYDALAESIRTGKPYQTRLNPPPADPRCCCPPPR